MECNLETRLQPFFTGIGTMLSLVTIVRSIYIYSQTPTKRKLLISIGSIGLFIYSIIFSMYYMLPNSRSLGGTIATMILLYTVNYCIVVASCKRYFAMLGERIQKMMMLGVELTVMGVFMLLMGVNSMDIAISPSLFNIRFSPWTLLIAIIPIIHIVFGVFGFVQFAKKRDDSQSAEYTVLSIQTGCTIFVFLMWIAWTVLYLLGKVSGGINGLLLAVVLEIENSIIVISRSVQSHIEKSSQHRSQIASRVATQQRVNND